MRRKEDLPELLAPAGSFEALAAAVNAGADAVYFGGGAFHARALAKNFDREEMKRALLYCRLHGVRSHITVNTLLFDRELPEALEYVRFLYENGADAVIVADMGLMAAIAREIPCMEIHASTQAGVHNLSGAEAFYRLGASRVVAAREMPFSDVRMLVDKASAEVEMFLHGALCVSRSGQCLFSSMVGGRSGNRGLCAQPCRLPYEGGYPLSLRDLSLAAHIPEIIHSGISSLKIEGRMKSPAYVAGVTAVYRRLLDEKRAATAEETETLRRIFCRGDDFTDGYFAGCTTVGMTGVRSEEQKRVSRALEEPDTALRKVACSAKVLLSEGVSSEMTLFGGGKQATVQGDIPSPARSAPLSDGEVRARLCRMGDTCFSLAPEEIDLTLGEGVFLAAGQLNALRRRAVEALENLFTAPKAPTDEGKEAGFACIAESVSGTAQAMSGAGAKAADAANPSAEMTVPDAADEMKTTAKTETTAGKTAAVGKATAAEKANAPEKGVAPWRDAAAVRGQNDIWGVFRKAAVWAALPEKDRAFFSHAFVPLCEWETLAAGQAAVPDGKGKSADRGKNVTADLSSVRDRHTAENENACRKGNGNAEIIDGKADTAGDARRGLLPDGVQMPPVIFDSRWPEVRRMLHRAKEDGAVFALAAGAEQIPEILAAGLAPLGDFRFNITNRRSLAVVRAFGVADAVTSPELTLPQARDVGGRVWLYGRVPLMLLERCIMRERPEGCKGCESRPLTDRTGAKFPVLRLYPHRNELFNSLPTYMGDKLPALKAAGFSRYVMLFSDECAARVSAVIAAVRAGAPLDVPQRRWPSEKIR